MTLLAPFTSWITEAPFDVIEPLTEFAPVQCAYWFYPRAFRAPINIWVEEVTLFWLCIVLLAEPCAIRPEFREFDRFDI